MRRALAVWKRNAPEIAVTPVPVENSQFYTHGIGASVQQIRGVIHEYAAMVAYWYRGWI